MRTMPKEYSLSQLLDNPAEGLVMENAGIDRRSLELMLEATRRQIGGSELRLPHAPFVS